MGRRARNAARSVVHNRRELRMRPTDLAFAAARCQSFRRAPCRDPVRNTQAPLSDVARDRRGHTARLHSGHGRRCRVDVARSHPELAPLAREAPQPPGRTPPGIAWGILGHVPGHALSRALARDGFHAVRARQTAARSATDPRCARVHRRCAGGGVRARSARLRGGAVSSTQLSAPLIGSDVWAARRCIKQVQAVQLARKQPRAGQRAPTARLPNRPPASTGEEQGRSLLPSRCWRT